MAADDVARDPVGEGLVDANVAGDDVEEEETVEVGAAGVIDGAPVGSVELRVPNGASVVAGGDAANVLLAVPLVALLALVASSGEKLATINGAPMPNATNETDIATRTTVAWKTGISTSSKYRGMQTRDAARARCITPMCF